MKSLCPLASFPFYHSVVDIEADCAVLCLHSESTHPGPGVTQLTRNHRVSQ